MYRPDREGLPHSQDQITEQLPTQSAIAARGTQWPSCAFRAHNDGDGDADVLETSR